MSSTLKTSGSVPRQLFFQTAAQRTALARQQFFEEGTRPSGLVGEAVIQSWMRCHATHEPTSTRLAFNAVTSSRLHATLRLNRQLLEAASPELSQLEASLVGTDCRVLLTDPQGVIVHATQNPFACAQPLLTMASRVGVNIAEGAVGTTAPGIVAKTGQAYVVTGAEHFFDCLQTFQCAAAPIRDVQGRLAAVLDLTIEARAFGFDAASVVGMYATMIENRLLQTQSQEHLILRFQANATLLGTPMEALAGITADGQVAWLNNVAARLTSTPSGTFPCGVETVFNLGLAQLLQRVRTSSPQPLRLPSGLGVWVQAVLQARDGVDFGHAVAHAVALAPESPPPLHPLGLAPEPTAPVSPATLEDHSLQLIESTLLACSGNISKAARALGVSRGTLYRKLQGSAVANSLSAADSER